MSLKQKHLLSLAPLSVDDVRLILETADSFKEVSGREIKKVPALRGRTVVNLFFEPSTRTRTSSFFGVGTSSWLIRNTSGEPYSS